MTTEHLGTGEPGLVTSTAHPAKPEILVRVGVVAALACGALTTLHEVWEDAIPGIQQGAGWSLLHTSWLAAMFVAFLGITAVQRPGLDKFGRIATRTALVGTGAQTIMAAIETGTLVGRTPTSDDPAAPILAAILAVFAVYVAGMILLSVATIRAGRSATVCGCGSSARRTAQDVRRWRDTRHTGPAGPSRRLGGPRRLARRSPVPGAAPDKRAVGGHTVGVPQEPRGDRR